MDMDATVWRAGRAAAMAWLLAVAGGLGGCTAPAMMLGAAGVASDNSITWEVVKHLHAKMTEGDDVPCVLLDSVQRALSPRCGAFVAGSLRSKDIATWQRQGCPLALAVRDPRLWPVVPELLDKGAQPEACDRSPLAELAQRDPCPDFGVASPASLGAIAWMAQADGRAIQHDVVRMLSCPNARQVGLDRVLQGWLEQGDLDVHKVGFGVLGALDPRALDSPLALALQAQGHSARGSLGSYVGSQPRGFEAALRASDWKALDWWLTRVPELANRVPPSQGGQLPWVPLARVLSASFLEHADSQAEVVAYLLGRGADPGQRLPYDNSLTVLQYARALRSPMVPLMQPDAELTVAVRATPAQP